MLNIIERPIPAQQIGRYQEDCPPLETYAKRTLLSSNQKLAKTPAGRKVINAGLSFAPSKRAGVQVCPWATASCIAACVLWFGGRTVSKAVRQAAIARTMFWYWYKREFFARLDKEIKALVRKAKRNGAQAYCRLNVASDIDYTQGTEHNGGYGARHLFHGNPDCTMYDYTKEVDRAERYGRGELPSNYHVSYSVHENTTYADAKKLHDLGVNLVVVFDSDWTPAHGKIGRLPKWVHFRNNDNSLSAEPCNGFTVKCINGDQHDIRTPEYDGRGNCVALHLKGTNKAKANARQSGFARPFELGQTWSRRILEIVGSRKVWESDTVDGGIAYVDLA